MVAVGLLSGCTWFSWLPWVDRDDAKRQLEPAKLERFDQMVRVRREWSSRIGGGLGKKYLRVNPAVAGDRIFAADGYGIVEARNRFDGKRVWRARIGDNPKGFFSRLNFFDRRDPAYVTGGVGTAMGMVLIGTAHGEVVALSAADGGELWRTRVGSEVLAPPIGGSGVVMVQTIDGRLLALERNDGRVRWSFDTQVPILTLRGTSTPVHNGGVVYAGFANGSIAAVRVENGEPLWQHQVMLPEGRSELERMVDVDGTPVILGGVVYVVSYQGRLAALRAADGSLLWERELSSHLDLANGYGQIYVIDDEDRVHAVDQRSAEPEWTQAGLFRRRLTSPVAFSNYLVVVDEKGYLHVLAQSDGRFLGRIRVDRKGVRSRPVVEGDQLYVLGNSGSLRAYSIELR